MWPFVSEDPAKQTQVHVYPHMVLEPIQQMFAVCLSVFEQRAIELFSTSEPALGTGHLDALPGEILAVVAGDPMDRVALGPSAR